MKRNAKSQWAALVLLALLAPGCILVRTTEHWIKLNKDGSGEATLRLIDLRSDGTTDSAVVRDYGTLMGSLKKNGYSEFEHSTRKVSDAQFFVHGDTLSVEIKYTFQALSAVEGLRVKEDKLYMAVYDSREIVRTNGDVATGQNHIQTITWPRDATRLMYVIREKQLPPSTALGPFYLKFGR